MNKRALGEPKSGQFADTSNPRKVGDISMTAWARSLGLLMALGYPSTACSDQAHAPGFLPGYAHSFERSRFDLGEFVSEMDEFGMHKLVGSHGTFATELVSAGAHAVPNNPFPDPTTGVYPGDSDAQNAAVQSYFTAAGLPADQVASVSADGATRVHGQDVLSGWYSILHRGYDGIPIDDSIAAAALNAGGLSSSEQVYWPDIPVDVLEQARVFKKMLADPTKRAAYIQKLPASSRDAILVIHHTSSFWQGPFEAKACCRGSINNHICFDMNGNLIQLPDEVTANQ